MADREVNDDYLLEQQPHEEQEDNTETEAEKEKNVRTYTICKEILSLRAQKLKKKLEVNHLGQPIGRSSITSETYMVYLACTQVPTLREKGFSAAILSVSPLKVCLLAVSPLKVLKDNWCSKCVPII